MSRPSPRESEASLRTVSRRALVVGGLQLGVMSVLGWRMKQMQIDQADEFRLLAEENRINLRLIPPSRGNIFDVNGVPLAVNEQNYRIVVVREDAGDVDAVLAKLKDLIGLDDETIADAREEIAKRSAFVPVTVKDRVTWEEISRVTVNAPALPGVYADVGLSRFYPRGSDTAHVVGYVGPVSDYDLSRIEDPDPVLQIPKFEIGKTGAENKLEELLRGEAGTKRIEVNSAGREMREIDRIPGTSGADIQLTIDSRLQAYTEARLHGESAGVVVIDCTNGDLKAVASAPSFDPNLFVRGISTTDWTALNENIYRPLAAKTVQGAYPPGSTYKMMTAIAALEAGVITPDETVYCPGFTQVGGTRFHCWKRGGHGNVNLHESLKQSCDCYYYEVSQRVGIDKMAEISRKFGLGQRHDIPMSAISEGNIPDQAWKRDNRGEAWRIGDTVNASIGQGYVLASPLQLAVMTARLATGREVKPRLVHTIDGVEQPSGLGESLGLNENFLRRIRASMYDVVNHGRGTSYGKRILTEGMQMAGKTGTSQVRRITPEERARGVTSNADLPWERRDHALFVDFAPYENPKYAVAVVVEHGGGGSTAAAPIGRDVTLQALFEGDPPLDAYPSNLRAEIEAQQERIRNFISAGSIPTPPPEAS